MKKKALSFLNGILLIEQEKAREISWWSIKPHLISHLKEKQTNENERTKMKLVDVY